MAAGGQCEAQEGGPRHQRLLVRRAGLPAPSPPTTVIRQSQHQHPPVQPQRKQDECSPAAFAPLQADLPPRRMEFKLMPVYGKASGTHG